MNVNDLRERLAALEHEQWISWMQYMSFSKLSIVENSDEKTVIITFGEKTFADLIQKMKSDYKDFIEEEKVSDRLWADKTIKIMKEFISTIYFSIGTPEFDTLMFNWYKKSGKI